MNHNPCSSTFIHSTLLLTSCCIPDFQAPGCRVGQEMIPILKEFSLVEGLMSFLSYFLSHYHPIGMLLSISSSVAVHCHPTSMQCTLNCFFTNPLVMVV
jgi:hypothetical protein